MANQTEATRKLINCPTCEGDFRLPVDATVWPEHRRANNSTGPATGATAQCSMGGHKIQWPTATQIVQRGNDFAVVPTDSE